MALYRFTLPFIFLFFSACSSTSKNTEGKPFDANSQYCKQLLNDIKHPYTNQISAIKPNQTNVNPHDERYTPERTKMVAEQAYARDCESHSGMNKRLKIILNE